MFEAVRYQPKDFSFREFAYLLLAFDVLYLQKLSRKLQKGKEQVCVVFAL
jgi:hypothetical protein